MSMRASWAGELLAHEVNLAMDRAKVAAHLTGLKQGEVVF